MTSTHTIPSQAPHQPHILLRAIYFLVFGLWFSAIWASIAWFASITIIGLPVGIWMLNRLPLVTTLRMNSPLFERTANGTFIVYDRPQHSFIIRTIYFLLIGWWFSAFWLATAWALSAILIGLPLSFWMIDRTPAALTLAR